MQVAPLIKFCILACTHRNTNQRTHCDINTFPGVFKKKHWASVFKSLSCTHPNTHTHIHLTCSYFRSIYSIQLPVDQWTGTDVIFVMLAFGEVISFLLSSAQYCMRVMLILRACERYTIMHDAGLRSYWDHRFPHFLWSPQDETFSNHAGITWKISFYTNLWRTSAHALTNRDTKYQEKMRRGKDETRGGKTKRREVNQHKLKQG